MKHLWISQRCSDYVNRIDVHFEQKKIPFCANIDAQVSTVYVIMIKKEMDKPPKHCCVRCTQYKT